MCALEPQAQPPSPLLVPYGRRLGPGVSPTVTPTVLHGPRAPRACCAVVASPSGLPAISSFPLLNYFYLNLPCPSPNVVLRPLGLVEGGWQGAGQAGPESSPLGIVTSGHRGRALRTRSLTWGRETLSTFSCPTNPQLCCLWDQKSCLVALPGAWRSHWNRRDRGGLGPDSFPGMPQAPCLQPSGTPRSFFPGKQVSILVCC